MGRSFFIWKNKDCRSMGVILRGPLPIIRPEERVNHIEIPGASGDLTQLEGEDNDPVWNSYIQTAEIEVKGGFHVREVYNWLRGAGYFTSGSEPDRKQPARVIGAITLQRHSKNLDWWVGECQFYCQPEKELLNEAAVTITSSGSAVMNSGDLRARPRIIATASGTSMTITANGRTLTVAGLTSGQDYIIDCKICEVLSGDATTVLTAASSGRFPVLEPGSNTITGSGWSKLVIDRRQRFL